MEWSYTRHGVIPDSQWSRLNGQTPRYPIMNNIVKIVLIKTGNGTELHAMMASSTDYAEP